MEAGVVGNGQVDSSELHSLLLSTYAYMDKRIDPPSSLYRMTIDDLINKMEQETLIAVSDGGALVGCLFCRPMTPWLYVGKMAVAESAQGRGVGRSMIELARTLARDLGLDGLELETRIELTENHATFAAFGFVKVADQSHDGYDRVTSIRMRALLEH